jgi:hypothetical protein
MWLLKTNGCFAFFLLKDLLHRLVLHHAKSIRQSISCHTDRLDGMQGSIHRQIPNLPSNLTHTSMTFHLSRHDPQRLFGYQFGTQQGQFACLQQLRRPSFHLD